MFRTRHHRQLLVVCLTLAAVLYRGLIPAGFMPASGEAAAHGALLVVCPHGDMVGMEGMSHQHGAHEHPGSGPGGTSLQQCPFGVAGAPALQGAGLALPPGSGIDGFRPQWEALSRRDTSPAPQPPARGPPQFS
jgi:hypothetical protein